MQADRKKAAKTDLGDSSWMEPPTISDMNFCGRKKGCGPSSNKNKYLEHIQS